MILSYYSCPGHHATTFSANLATFSVKRQNSDSVNKSCRQKCLIFALQIRSVHEKVPIHHCGHCAHTILLLADRSGFYTIRTFQRSFLAVTGKTPSEYSQYLKTTKQ